LTAWAGLWTAWAGDEIKYAVNANQQDLTAGINLFFDITQRSEIPAHNLEEE
jgi:hypothetical protein